MLYAYEITMVCREVKSCEAILATRHLIYVLTQLVLI